MTEKILILDFGSQYTQLIARAVRECNVYCEIVPFQKGVEKDPSIKGVILSGSPFSVNDPESPDVDVQEIVKNLPLLGVCYGAQLTAKRYGGKVAKSNKREFGRAILSNTAHPEDPLLNGVSASSQVWMSHGDTILSLPEHFEVLATTDSIPVAAFKAGDTEHALYGLQFHPEVYHSTEGKKILKNFQIGRASCRERVCAIV